LGSDPLGSYMNVRARKHKGISNYIRTVWTRTILVFCGILVAGWAVAAGEPELDKKPKDEAEKRERLYQVRVQLIQKLEEFKQSHPEYMRRAEYKHRLGENYFELAKYYDYQNRPTESKAYMDKAIALLEDIRANESSYSEYPKAMFILASAYKEAQSQSKAGEVLAELSGKFPNSPVMKEASMLLGDYYFDKGQAAKAEGYYKSAAASDPKMQSYLYYKLGWANLNQGRSSAALDYFEKVLAMRGTEAASVNDYSKEAAREMLWPALDIYKPKGLIPYLEKVQIDAETIQSNLNSLAQGLMKKSAFAAVSQIYEELQIKYPTSSLMTEWVSGQIKAEEAMGRTQRIGELMARLKGAGVEAVSVEAQVQNSAKKFHAEALKAKTASEKISRLNLASGYYRAALSSMDAAKPEALETKFYLAETLYAQGKFPESTALYEEVAKGNHKLSGQAAWAWFLSAEKNAEGFRHTGKTFKPATSSDEKYLEAAQYIQNISTVTAEQKRRATYQSARLLYQLQDLDRALPIFQGLADGSGATTEGKLSAQLVLDIYNQKNDFKAVAQYARAYQANADAGTKAELSSLAQKASLKTLEQEERDAKALQGEARFTALENISRKFVEYAESKGELSDQLLWASVQNFAEVALERKDNEFRDVRSSFKMLASRYPNSSYTKKAIPFMGKFLGYRGGLSNEILREFAGYRNQWRNLVDDEPAEQRGRYIMMLYKMSDSSSEKRAFIRDAARLPKTEGNREALAYVQLAKVEDLKDKIEGISMKNVKTLGRATAQRANLLDALQAEVTNLVKMKVAEPAISGLNLLGDANLEMASAIRQSPIPAALKGADLQKYQGIVREKAEEFEAKGREAQRLAAERASDLKLNGSAGS